MPPSTETYRRIRPPSSGTPPPWDVPGFDDAEEAARAAVIAVQNCPWLPHRDDVRGFVFDVDSGLLQQVDPS
jgi:carbonic anhydrase